MLSSEIMTVQETLGHPTLLKLTVEDFLLLDGSGALDAYAKSELIDGAIVVMNAQHSDHFVPKTLLLRRLADACDALGRGYEAWVEGGVAMPPHNAPEPDIFVTKSRPTSGLTRLSTVVLLIEVSSTTVSFERGRKSAIYAAAGVPGYWIVDLPARTIRQLWSPTDDGFGDSFDVRIGERVNARTTEGLSVVTDGF